MYSSVCPPQAVTAVHPPSTACPSGNLRQAVPHAGTEPVVPWHSLPPDTSHPAVSQPSQASSRPAEPSTSSPAGNAVFFTTYEGLRRSFPGRRQPLQQDSTLLSVLADSASAITCGGIAGTVMWAVGVSAAQETAVLPCCPLLTAHTKHHRRRDCSHPWVAAGVPIVPGIGCDAVWQCSQRQRCHACCCCLQLLHLVCQMLSPLPCQQ